MGSHHSQTKASKWHEVCLAAGKDGGYSSTKAGHSVRQGKPSPPHGAPSVSDITHNAVLLSWLPPKQTNGCILAYYVEMRYVTGKEWITLTKSCQGNSYKVRSLEANSAYLFRVRAENIFGRSKPGNISETVLTSSFDVHDFVSVKERKVTVKRRSSLNIQVPVEDRVASILNHSTPIVETISVKSYSLQRDGFQSSLQNHVIKKRSGSSLIPGTKTHSLSKLRASQMKPLDNKDRTCADIDTKSDLGSECNTMSQSSESDYASQDQNSSGPSSPIEDSVDEIRITDDLLITIPTCLKHQDFIDLNERLYCVSDEGIDTSAPPQNPDFRTLHSILQSSDVIVKPTQSLPEISDMFRGKAGRGSLRLQLTTITDEDDNDNVRVTTL